MSDRSCLILAGAWFRHRLLVGPSCSSFLVLFVTFFVLFVFVLCFARPMLPIYLEGPFLLPLRFSLAFIHIFDIKANILTDVNLFKNKLKMKLAIL